MSKETNSTTNLIDDYLGTNLKQWRELRDMTQDDLNAAMSFRGFEFNRDTVYKIERGKRRVLLGEGLALAEILEIPLEALTRSPEGSDVPYLHAMRLNARGLVQTLNTVKDFLEQAKLQVGAIEANASNLHEPTAQHDFNGTQATATDFYKPLTQFPIEAALKHIQDNLEAVKAQTKYLNA